MNSEALTVRISEVLEAKKGMDIRVVDVREKTSMTDYFVFVTGSSSPHLKALYEDVHVTLKHEGQTTYRRTGDPEGGWLVLDFVDVVVHIFLADLREHYAIETLWEERGPLAETPPEGEDPKPADSDTPQDFDFDIDTDAK